MINNTEAGTPLGIPPQASNNRVSSSPFTPLSPAKHHTTTAADSNPLDPLMRVHRNSSGNRERSNHQNHRISPSADVSRLVGVFTPASPLKLTSQDVGHSTDAHNHRDNNAEEGILAPRELHSPSLPAEPKPLGAGLPKGTHPTQHRIPSGSNAKSKGGKVLEGNGRASPALMSEDLGSSSQVTASKRESKQRGKRERNAKQHDVGKEKRTPRGPKRRGAREDASDPSNKTRPQIATGIKRSPSSFEDEDAHWRAIDGEEMELGMCWNCFGLLGRPHPHKVGHHARSRQGLGRRESVDSEEEGVGCCCGFFGGGQRQVAQSALTLQEAIEKEEYESTKAQQTPPPPRRSLRERCCPPNRCLPFSAMTMLVTIPLMMLVAASCLVAANDHMVVVTRGWLVNHIRMHHILATIEGSRVVNEQIGTVAQLRDQLRVLVSEYLPISESLGMYNASEPQPSTLCDQIELMRAAEVERNASLVASGAAPLDPSETRLAEAAYACTRRPPDVDPTADESPFAFTPNILGAVSSFSMAGWNMSVRYRFRRDIVRLLVSTRFGASTKNSYIIVIPGRVRITVNAEVRNYSWDDGDDDDGDQFVNIEWVAALQPPVPIPPTSAFRYRYPYRDLMYADSNLTEWGGPTYRGPQKPIYPHIYTAVRKAQEFDLYVLQNCSVNWTTHTEVIGEDYNVMRAKVSASRSPNGTSLGLPVCPGVDSSFFTNRTRQQEFNTGNVSGLFYGSSPPEQTVGLYARSNMTDFCEFYTSIVTRGRVDSGNYTDITHDALTMVSPFTASHEPDATEPVLSTAVAPNPSGETVSTFSRNAHRTFPDFLATRASPLSQSVVVNVFESFLGPMNRTIAAGQQRITVTAEQAKSVLRESAKRISYFPEWSRLTTPADNSTNMSFTLSIPLALRRRTYLNATATLAESLRTLNGAPPSPIDPSISFDVAMYVSNRIPQKLFVKYLDVMDRATPGTVHFVINTVGTIVAAQTVGDSTLIPLLSPQLRTVPMVGNFGYCLNYSETNGWYHWPVSESNSYDPSQVDARGMSYLPPGYYKGICFPHIAQISKNLKRFYTELLAPQLSSARADPSILCQFDPQTVVIAEDGDMGDGMGSGESQLGFLDILTKLHTYDVISISSIETVSSKISGELDVPHTLCDNSTEAELVFPNGTINVPGLMRTCAFARYSTELNLLLVSVTPGTDMFSDLLRISIISLVTTSAVQLLLLLIAAWQISVFARQLAALATRIGHAAQIRDTVYIEELSRFKELRGVQLAFVALAARLRDTMRKREILLELQTLLRDKKKKLAEIASSKSGESGSAALEAALDVEVAGLTASRGENGAEEEPPQDEIPIAAHLRNSDLEMIDILNRGLQPPGMERSTSPVSPGQHQSTQGTAAINPVSTLSGVSRAGDQQVDNVPQLFDVHEPNVSHSSQAETTPTQLLNEREEALGTKNRKQLKLLGLGSPLNPLVACPVTILRITIEPHRMDATLFVLRELIPLIQQAVVSKPRQLLELRREHARMKKAAERPPLAHKSATKQTATAATPVSPAHASAAAVDGIVYSIATDSISIAFLPLTMLRVLYPHRYSPELFPDYVPHHQLHPQQQRLPQQRHPHPSKWQHPPSTPPRANGSTSPTNGDLHSGDTYGSSAQRASAAELHLAESASTTSNVASSSTESRDAFVLRALAELDKITPTSLTHGAADAALKALMVASALQRVTQRGSVFSYYAAFYYSLDTEVDALVDVRSAYKSSSSPPPALRHQTSASLLSMFRNTHSGGIGLWSSANSQQTPIFQDSGMMLHPTSDAFNNTARQGAPAAVHPVGALLVHEDYMNADPRLNWRCPPPPSTDSASGRGIVQAIPELLHRSSTATASTEEARHDAKVVDSSDLLGRHSSFATKSFNFEATWGPQVDPRILFTAPSGTYVNGGLNEQEKTYPASTAKRTDSVLLPQQSRPSATIEMFPFSVAPSALLGLYPNTSRSTAVGAAASIHLADTAFRAVLCGQPTISNARHLHNRYPHLLNSVNSKSDGGGMVGGVAPALLSQSILSAGKAPATLLPPAADVPEPSHIPPILLFTSSFEVTTKVARLQVHRLKTALLVTDRFALNVPSKVMRYAAPLDCVELQVSFVGPLTASRINQSAYNYGVLPKIEEGYLGALSRAASNKMGTKSAADSFEGGVGGNDVLSMSRSAVGTEISHLTSAQLVSAPTGVHAGVGGAGVLSNTSTSLPRTSPASPFHISRGASSFAPPSVAGPRRLRATDALRAEFFLLPGRRHRSHSSPRHSNTMQMTRSSTAPPEFLDPPLIPMTPPSHPQRGVMDHTLPPFFHSEQSPHHKEDNDRQLALVYNPNSLAADPHPALLSEYQLTTPAPSTQGGSSSPKKRLVKVKKSKAKKATPNALLVGLVEDEALVPSPPRQPSQWVPPSATPLQPAPISAPAHHNPPSTQKLLLRDISSSSDDDEDAKAVEGLPTERRFIRVLEGTEIGVHNIANYTDAGLLLTTVEIGRTNERGDNANTSVSEFYGARPTLDARSAYAATTTSKGHLPSSADLLRRRRGDHGHEGGTASAAGAAASAARSQAGPPSEYFGGSAYAGSEIEREELSQTQEPYNLSLCGSYVTIRMTLLDPLILSINPDAAHSLFMVGTTAPAAQAEKELAENMSNHDRQRVLAAAGCKGVGESSSARNPLQLSSKVLSPPPLPPLRPSLPGIRLQQFQQAFRMLIIGNYVGAVSFIEDLIGSLHRSITEHSTRHHEYEATLDEVIRRAQNQTRKLQQLSPAPKVRQGTPSESNNLSEEISDSMAARSATTSVACTADAVRAHQQHLALMAEKDGEEAADETPVQNNAPRLDREEAVRPLFHLVGHLSRWKRIAALHANQRHSPYIRRETPQFENSKSIRYILQGRH